VVATIKELAKLAGVTETTVSLSFQKGSRISEKTRKRILALARQVDYIPSFAARQLRNGKTNMLGIVVLDMTNPFFSLVSRVAEKVAAKRGYEMLITDSQWKAEKEVAEVETLIRHRAAGVLICMCEKTTESLAWLDRLEIPHLLIDTYPEGYPGAYVANDLAEAGRLGARHLLEIGCRNIAFVTADQANVDYSGFKIMKQEFGSFCWEQPIDFSEKNIYMAGLTVGAGERIFGQILATQPEVEGIFCANSLCALGVLDAARAAGKKPAIIGVDDLEVCSLGMISLTTIRQPYEQLAQVATDVLINSIEDNTAPAIKMSLKPELVIRDSTKLWSKT
jgi:LacI family transcriptional regulator